MQKYTILFLPFLHFRLGRRISFLIGLAVLIISGIILSLVMELYTIGVFRLLIGMASQQMFLSVFVIGKYCCCLITASDSI